MTDNNALAQPDWTQIAKAAGEHGVRYRTNSALLAFLAEIRTPAPASGEVGELVEALRTTRGDLFSARSLCNEAADMLERLAGPVQSSPDESLGWERGMRDAANICGSLAETTYDDADAFEAATGCEAAIQLDLKMHQQNRLAGPVQQPVIKLDQCYLCGTLAPEAFAAQCNRPECVYRQPVQQPGVEQVAEVGMALCESALGGKRCPCREIGKFNCVDSYPGQQARAAIAAMQPKGE